MSKQQALLFHGCCFALLWLLVFVKSSGIEILLLFLICVTQCLSMAFRDIGMV